MLAHCEPCSACCSRTSRTARSRTSVEYHFVVAIDFILSQVEVSGKTEVVQAAVPVARPAVYPQAAPDLHYFPVGSS
jgi:hypothetical protein